MNKNYIHDDIGKASILMHEVTHKYGWRHNGDERNVNDNINSFPYAVGIDFEEYLRNKETKK